MYALGSIPQPMRFLSLIFFQGWGLYAEYLGEEMGMYENDYEM